MPRGHTVISLAAGGAVWAATGSPWAVPAALVAGVLIDVDHLVDYLELALTMKRRHFFVPLHGYELAVVGFVAAFFTGWNPIALGAAAGYAGHVLADAYANHVPKRMYSLAFRLARGFRSHDPWDPDSVDRRHADIRLLRWILRKPVLGPALFALNPRLKQAVAGRRSEERDGV